MGLFLLIVFFAFACAVLHLAGRALGRRSDRAPRLFGSLSLVAVFGLIALMSRPELVLAAGLVPVCAPIEEYLVIPLAMGLCGVAPGLLKGRARAGFFHVLAALLFVGGVAGSALRVWPYDRSPLEGKVEDGVVLQSTDDSCVAASLATMLCALGIPATEAEMADASLLLPGMGTSDLRACRALQAKTAGMGWRVRIAHPRVPPDGPARAPRAEDFHPPCLFGMTHPQSGAHMLVLLAIEADACVVGDPLAGRMRWTHELFARRYLGRVIYLERE